MRYLSALLKAGLAVALIAWMVTSGRLDPTNLAGAFRHKGLLLGACALMYCQVVITAVRWHMLLLTQGVRLRFRETLSLNMIGTLFNTVIPGAVGGDVMKGYYVSRRAPAQRAHAVTTLLVDRVLGLVSLLLLPLIATLWNLELVSRSRAIQAVLAISAMGVIAAVAGFLLAIFFGDQILALLGRWSHVRLAQVASKVLTALIQYRNHTAAILTAVGIGLLNHLLGIYAFLLCVRAVSDVEPDLASGLLVVPLGLVTMAIPISPAGVGVGQAAFFTLFSIVPGLSGRIGSEACTVFQFTIVAVYLTGFIPYIFYRESASAPVEVLQASRSQPSATE